MEEDRKKEDGILRAQKLESIGILAGGFSHDYQGIGAPCQQCRPD